MRASSSRLSGIESVTGGAVARRIETADGASVSALLLRPHTATACLVLAHGAGAGMTHPFMAAIADGLAARHIATLRFQFPFMERGGGAPDRPPKAQVTVRAAVAAAAAAMPDLPLFAGGKSFGGRMTSMAQAETPLPDVRGLVFLGFPLHAAKKPSVARAAHLAEIGVPMLFLSGTRDALAEITLLTEATRALGPKATLLVSEQADHSFHVPKRTGRSDVEVMDVMLDRLATWIGARLQD